MAEACFKGPLHPGKTGLVMSECPDAAGSKTVNFTTDADSILISVYVESIAGDLDVVVYTVGAAGQTKKVITFATISATTTELVFEQADVTLDNIQVVATYTGAAKFDIRAKGLHGSPSVEVDFDPDEELTVTGPKTNPLIQNVSLGVANNETSIALPADCKEFHIRAQSPSNAKLKLSFVSGASGTTYRTIWAGETYIERDLKDINETLYVQANKASTIVELVTWT